MAIPDDGLPAGEVLRRVEEAASDDLPWRDGLGWSLVYNASPEHMKLVETAGAMYADANGLSHSAFPSLAQFESAVLSMVASVVHPGAASYGVFTTGGTESILLAMKAYRDTDDRGRSEVLIPRTAHPAYRKAAQLLGLTPRTIEVGSSRRADPEDIAAAISDATLVVGVSAPNFPFGVVDPVSAIATVARDREVGLHVDAAVGGLFLPFVDGWSQPFGLDLDGVTSVSVDLHKYGYGLKGASALMFATNDLRRGAYYLDTGWPGGALASASVAGTRSGRAAAGAYASLLHLGRSGLRARVAEIMTTTRTLLTGLGELGLAPVAEPDMSVFAVASRTADDAAIDVRAIAAGLQDRGWWMDVQSDPDALHFVVMHRHASVVSRFLADAAAVVASPPTVGAAARGGYGVMVRHDSAHDEPVEALSRYLDGRYDLTP
jgi:glutamate/tyrosine decarboxylase-like PLP-dependent enzyme